MPTYDYICSSCGNAWEFEQRIVEDPIKQCPKCGAMTAKRQISAGAGFILKGGGWYADLYGSKPSGNTSKDDDKGSKSDTKLEKSTEKSAEKSETAKSDTPKESSGSGSSGDKGSPTDKGTSPGGDTKAA